MGNFRFSPSVDVLMADSGTSLNMIPDEDFYKIFNQFMSGLRCRVLPNSLTSCDCTLAEHLRVPAISFKINQDDYMISRDSWFERKGNQCTIKFMHSPHESQWILGLNFFHSYYTVPCSITRIRGLGLLRPSIKASHQLLNF